MLNPKSVSKNHLTEKRFKPYNNATPFIKHLNKIYEAVHKNGTPDKAYFQSKIFQTQSPTNTDFKVSVLPKARVSKELEAKKELFDKFTNLESIRPVRKKALIRSFTPVNKKPKHLLELSDLHEFRNMVHSILTEKGKKCEDCKKVVCECVEKTQDVFLKRLVKTGVLGVAKKKELGREITKERKERVIEVEVVGKERIFCSLLEDGSFLTIARKKRKKAKVVEKSKKDCGELMRIMAVAPASLSERPRSQLR